MKIIVPIKQVPETNAVKMDEATGTMVRDGVEAIINPLDLYAIECALRLRQEHGGEVVAISMGPPKAETALREAIAMGCDSGVLVSDKAFGGADTWATSYVLSAAIKKIGDVDLIICGERATDGDTGQVGPGIAAFLDLPVVTYVSGVNEMDGRHCIVRRLVEEGCEVLDMQLPGVLTVVKEVADPRLPTLRGKLKAKTTPLPVFKSSDLEITPDKIGLSGSPTRVVKIFKPKVTRQCKKLVAADEASVNRAAAELLDFLSEKDLLNLV